MLCHDPNSPSGLRTRWLRPLALTLALLAAAHVALAGDAPRRPRAAPKPLWQLTLERLRALPAAERLALIEKANLGELATRKVTRGPLRLEIVERGSLDSAKNSDIICAVRARSQGSTIATTIRWVIPEGTSVRKGEKIIELDSSGLQEELKTRKLELAQALAAYAKARENLEQVRGENDADIRLMDIDVRLAELRAKRADPDSKEEHALHIEQARLRLKRVKDQARAREAIAQEAVRLATTTAQQEKARKSEVEAEIAKCTVLAPQDGLVVYYVPEQVRGGGGSQQSIVAQGEPVREGQKMLQIPDLSTMMVNVRVHEALVSHLRDEGDPKDKRTWQHAEIRVDAFPDHVLRGHVKHVDTVASQQDWFASDVKLYKTVVSIDQPLDGLRPGMSAEVRIAAAQTPGPVLHVPVQSVMRSGKKQVCWILTEKNLEEREVVTGLANDHAVEIRSGLKEGDWVVVSPRALARRVAPWLLKRGKAGGDVRGPLARPPAVIEVRSIKPAEERASPRRSWIARYGLTYDDSERIAALPTVGQVVPVRTFAQEARRLGHVHAVTVVATTPAFADLKGLEMEEGRFLNEDDGRHFRNVAVLGAALAEEMFPARDPVGAAVVVGKYPYRVVGVLRKHGEAAREGDRAIYLPLRTCQVRFGPRVFIVRGSSRTAEEVALHALLVTVPDPRHAADTAEDIRDLLRQMHTEKDWSVEAPAAP